MTMSSTEIRNRIRLSIAAFSYEYRADPILTDAQFDELSKQIQPDLSTGHKLLDTFFREEFNPDTGLWIHKHPELRKLEVIYNKYFNKEND